MPVMSELNYIPPPEVGGKYKPPHPSPPLEGEGTNL